MLTMPSPVPRWLMYVLTSPSSPIHIQSARKLRKASKSAITLLYRIASLLAPTLR